jgi:replicative DNA helicase
MTEEATPSGTYEFDDGFQRKIVALTLRDLTFSERTDGLVRPEYFANEIDSLLIHLAGEHIKKYRRAPTSASLGVLIKEALDAKVIRKDLVPEMGKRITTLYKDTDLSDGEFVVDKIVEFARHQAVERAMIESVSALGRRDFGKIEKLMQEALNVGAAESEPEYNYLKELENRTKERVAIAAGTLKKDGITTGIDEIDKLLHHGGWGRKELSAIMGRAKFGKSMGLGDFAKMAWFAGYKVLIVTLENSPKIYADRLDANISDMLMKELGTSPFDIEKRILRATSHLDPSGFIIRGFPSGMFTPSQLRRLLRRYRQKGIIFDLIVVDYGDIMGADNPTGDEYKDQGSVWLNLRGIGGEENAAMLTATQTTRGGAASMTAKATDVADSYNKTRIADLLISGNATEAEIASGEMRLFFAASRNQEGEFAIRVRQERAKMRFIKEVLGIER